MPKPNPYPLTTKHCIACEGNELQLTEPEIQNLLTQVPGWEVSKTPDNHPSIIKTFQFKDFVGSIDFVNKITAVAEAEGHHPDLYIRWDKVKVITWTHAIGGLHQNDFILAAKIDAIISNSASSPA